MWHFVVLNKYLSNELKKYTLLLKNLQGLSLVFHTSPFFFIFVFSDATQSVCILPVTFLYSSHLRALGHVPPFTVLCTCLINLLMLPSSKTLSSFLLQELHHPHLKSNLLLKDFPMSLHLFFHFLIYKNVAVQSLSLFHSLQPHGLQHSRLPCPLPSPRACSNSCPLSWWCHPTI